MQLNRIIRIITELTSLVGALALSFDGIGVNLNTQKYDQKGNPRASRNSIDV
jgi:hypothetical protein